MPASIRSGWGSIAAFFQTAKVAGGVESVLTNIGVGAQIIAGTQPLRLTKLAWRIDLAPDVAPGSVVAPDKYALFVLRGQLPSDITAFQNTLALQNELSIPSVAGHGSPLDILWQEWLDSAVSFPGLDIIAERNFQDSGPVVAAGEYMSILLTPVVFNIAQTAPGNCNAMHFLAAYGTSAAASGALGSGSGVGSPASLPRYGATFPEES